MGKRTWTAAQEEYLRLNYAEGNLSEISKHIGKDVKSIRERAYLLGIKRIKSGGFSKWEQEYIMANASKLSVCQIAKELKRGHRAINEFIFKNGIEQRAEFANFRCEPPDSCFNCPYEDCTATAYGTTAKEVQFLSAGMRRTVS